MFAIKQKEPDVQNLPGELIINISAYKSIGNLYMSFSSIALLFIWIYWLKVPFESPKNYLSWILVGGSFILGIVLLFWTFFGIEKIVIKGNKVFLSREIFSLGIKKIFNKSNLSEFVVDYSDVKILSQNKSILFGSKIGKIRFTDNGKRYSFGLSLNNSDADKIVGYINSRLNANE